MIAGVTQDTRLQTASSIQIRRATSADRDALVAMYLSFEPKGAALGLPPRKDPQRWLGDLAVYPNFVVYAEGRVAGHAVLCPEDGSGEVAVFVHQDYRGRGLGKMLLTELIDEARRLGLERVWGMTELDNFAMLGLARSLGFRTGNNPYEFYLDLHQQAYADSPLSAAA